MNTVTVPPGKYWVGDPSHLAPLPHTQEIANSIVSSLEEVLSSVNLPHEGFFYAGVNTVKLNSIETVKGSNNFLYPIFLSGFGIVSLSEHDPKDKPHHWLNTVIRFDSPSHFSYKDGVVSIGDVFTVDLTKDFGPHPHFKNYIKRYIKEVL